MPRFLLEETVDSFADWLREIHEQGFRAKQIIEWLWTKLEFDISKMSNLSLTLREKIKETFVVEPMTLHRVEASLDGETQKFLWRLHDGLFVESVLIGAPFRQTVCVSSQVGCPARCAFCASGKKGLVRNLSAAEIVYQIMAIQKRLSADPGEKKITNVVYMGMGEPLANVKEVAKSIRFLTDELYFNFSRRRVTVSTVGVVDGILALKDEKLGVNLSFSLHAPTQEKREKIIPFARKYTLQDILQALDVYRQETGRDITYEYILLSGFNDSVDDAHALADLLQKRNGGSVNLIPYNPVPDIAFVTPPPAAVERFRACLEERGVPVTCRYKKGDDIAAACGQLALAEL